MRRNPMIRIDIDTSGWFNRFSPREAGPGSSVARGRRAALPISKFTSFSSACTIAE
jgi:hypothetical protein